MRPVRRIAAAVAGVLAVALGAGVALAARAPVTSRQLTSLAVTQAAPTTTSTSTTAPPATFSPSSLALTNATGNTAGRPDAGDRVTIGFSAPLRQSSLCSAWTSDQSSRTLTGVTLTIDNDGPGNDANDRLVVSNASGCSGGFQLGHVDLGSKAFVTSSGDSFKDVPFTSSTIVVSGSTVTVTLGTPGTGGNDGTRTAVTSQTTAVFSPDADMRSAAGAAVTGTASATAVQW